MKSKGIVLSPRRYRTSSPGFRYLIYDGASYLRNATANWRSGDSAGAIEVWFRTTNTGIQTLFASCDEAGSAFYLRFAIGLSTASKLAISQRNNDTQCLAEGGTTVTDGCWHHAVLSSNGTAWTIILDGVAESLTEISGANDGDWFADTSNRDNLTIGVENINSLQRYMIGSIGYTRVYSREMAVAEALTNYSRGRNADASDTTGLVFNLPVKEGTGNPVDTVGALTMTVTSAVWVNEGCPPPTTYEDASRFKNNGTISGATLVQLDSGLWVLRYDGNDYIGCGTNPSLNFTTGFSLICWALIVPSVGSSPLMAKQTAAQWDANSAGYAFVMASGGIIRFRGSGEYIQYNGSYDDQVWRLYSVVWNIGETVKIYVDATIVIESGARAINWVNSANPLEIGRYYATTCAANGQEMGKMRIANFGYSAPQIRRYFDATKHLFGRV